MLAFLLLSLLVSGLNEGLVRLLGIRSKFLWAYLRDTLDGGEVIDKVPAVLGWLDTRLKGVSRLGRRLRSALADLLPPPKNVRSRLPATLLGVFAKLPFGKDPRPAFSPHPAPVTSPPLAAAPDSVIAAEVKTAVASGQPVDSVLPANIPLAEPIGAPAEGTATGETGAESSPESADSATGEADSTDERPVFVPEQLPAGVDPADVGFARAGTGSAKAAESGSGTVVSEVSEPTAGELAGGEAPISDPAHGAEQADSGDHGKSLTDLLHERLQEIDESKLGKTTISEIPPSRFSVALLEIATERGGVEPLLRDLQTLKSPLYRPMAAVWEKSGGSLPEAPASLPDAGTLPPQPQAAPAQPAAPAQGEAPVAVGAQGLASVDMEAFRRGMEAWFDGEMTRLTLLYRRYVRWAVGILSLVVTLLFSMDALEYGKTLLNDNAYRSAVAAFADQGEQALAPLKEQCAPEQDTYACVTEVLSTPAFVKIFSHAPVSATIPASGSPSWAWTGGDWWDRLRSPSHWPGFLLTLVALLFGAPFWWDMFRRITGLRSRTSTSATK
ncbi:hypothetical protein [Acrocarpospora catenulata]|uniref:hypothetical protein n=1 Tax=Acrocarpospora catenulata TaxID=2836182 RepID=UPI001BDB370F|nr:hypothetical protein [Acrocarpospora catenulata]